MFFWRGDGGSGRRNGNWGNGVVECDADRMGRPRGKSAIWRVHHRGGGGGRLLLNPNLLPALDRDVDRPPPMPIIMLSNQSLVKLGRGYWCKGCCGS